MIISILAAIGLYFIILLVYRKGKKDGIKASLDYFALEMKRGEINVQLINHEEHLEKLNKSKWINLLSFLDRRKK